MSRDGIPERGRAMEEATAGSCERLGVSARGTPLAPAGTGLAGRDPTDHLPPSPPHPVPPGSQFRNEFGIGRQPVPVPSGVAAAGSEPANHGSLTPPEAARRLPPSFCSVHAGGALRFP